MFLDTQSQILKLGKLSPKVHIKVRETRPGPGHPADAALSWAGTNHLLTTDLYLEATMSLPLFLKDVFINPMQMGAIAPSGPDLARVMVDTAQIEDGHTVVELGAGSGSFTREIVGRHPANPFFAFEISPRLGDELTKSFPSANVVVAPVEDLPKVAPAIGLRQIDRIVSGLPWALWSDERQAAIFDALLPFLAPDARFVTFHYVHSRALGRVRGTRRLLKERFAQVTNTEPVWSNLPPAYVHIAENPRSPTRAFAESR